MSTTGAMPVWLTLIQDEEDDMAYQVAVPLTLSSINGDQLIRFKVKDPPIIKSFNQSITGPTSGTKTETVEWDFSYTGAISNHIRAGTTNKMLVVLRSNISGSGTTAQLHASDNLDTNDGTIVWPTFAHTTSFFPPIPIILDVNQYLTLFITFVSQTRSVNIEGFTVDLPDNFSLT